MPDPTVHHVCGGRACVFCLVLNHRPIPADALVSSSSRRLPREVEQALAQLRRLLLARIAS